jgi:hypothetical protein
MLELLPLDIQIEILDFLDSSSLVRMLVVNRHWNSLAQRSSFWRKFCLQKAPNYTRQVEQQKDEAQWKDVFKYLRKVASEKKKTKNKQKIEQIF